MGVATGVVEKNKIIDGSSVCDGDVAIGVFSNGLHTNGYSLARKLIFESMGLTTSDTLPGYNISIGDSLLAPHTNYSSLIEKTVGAGIALKSISHITGGGLVDNVPRVVPKGFSLSVNTKSWGKIPIFEFLQNNLDIKKEDLYQTFNMGIGLVLIIDKSQKERLVSLVGKDNCSEIGFIIKDGLNSVHLSEQ